MRHFFSEAELEEARRAVVEAEQRTAGEIVPYIVLQSGSYRAAIWRGASFLAILALALSVLVFQFYQGWGLAWLYTGWGTALLALAAGTLGALLAAYVPPLKRLLAGRATMAERVHQRAMQAFVEEEVFKTRERTGILIFISLFEHHVEVLGDAGINRHVTPDDWAEVVAHLVESIRQHKLAEGLVEAFALCGSLLERSGVTLRPDDVNELSDEVRFRSGKRGS